MGQITSPFVDQTDYKPELKILGSQLTECRLAVKDLFHIAGLKTAAGNPDWAASHETPEHSSAVVDTLIAHGAKYVGKTITDELAYSLNGNNIHYPELYNALDVKRICGGSSSGSAYAVAMNIADIGLGTDTGGSIRVPASYNGLFGFRPSHGIISTQGLVSLAPDFDTVGWMTKSIDLLDTIAQCLLPPSDQIQHTPFRPLLINALVQHCDYSEQLTQWGERVFGQTLPDVPALSMDTLTLASEVFRTLQGRQIWQTHGEWIRQYKPRFAQDINTRFEWCATLSKQDELNGLDKQSHFVRLLREAMGNDHLLVLPTTPSAAPLQKSDVSWLANYRKDLMAYTCIAGLGGLPQLHMPIFRKDKQAYGVSLIGPKNSDLALLAYAKNLLEKHSEK